MGGNAEHFLRTLQHLPAAATHPWLQEQREQALAKLRDAGLPGKHLEDWRYTDTRAVCSREWRHDDDGSDTPLTEPELQSLRFPKLKCEELVFVNGQADKSLSRQNGSAPFASVADARQCAEFLCEKLPDQPDQRHGFALLNTAMFSQGTVIHVPEQVELEHPIHLFHIHTHTPNPIASYPRSLILLGKHARATVIESYIGMDHDSLYFHNAVSDVRLEEGAQLRHYRITQEGDRAQHIGCVSVDQERDSSFFSHCVSLGGGLARIDIDARLRGSGAHAALHGLYVATGKKHVDHHTRIDHIAPHTSSDEQYRGVLNQYGHGVFNGKIVIHKDAQHTEAHQSNDNLLLSPNASIDTKPELEIYADDVQCSHGATIGRMDEEMLFYLRSRALDEHDARSLLVFAFAEKVIRNIPDAPIRQKLEHTLSGQLPDTELLRKFLSAEEPGA